MRSQNAIAECDVEFLAGCPVASAAARSGGGRTDAWSGVSMCAYTYGSSAGVDVAMRICVVGASEISKRCVGGVRGKRTAGIVTRRRARKRLPITGDDSQRPESKAAKLWDKLGEAVE